MEKNKELDLLQEKLSEMCTNPNPIWNIEKIKDYKKAIEIATMLFGKLFYVSDINEPLKIHGFTVARKNLSFSGKELDLYSELIDLCDLVDVDTASQFNEFRVTFGFKLTNYKFEDE